MQCGWRRLGLIIYEYIMLARCLFYFLLFFFIFPRKKGWREGTHEPSCRFHNRVQSPFLFLKFFPPKKRFLLEALVRFLKFRTTLIWSERSKADEARPPFSWTDIILVEDELGNWPWLGPWTPNIDWPNDDIKEEDKPVRFPKSAQFGSDLRLLDQTVSRFNKEFAFGFADD